MRNRWSLFLSGFIVFATWYLVAYGVTSGTFAGVLTGLAFGLAVIVGGLILGAGAGVAGRAIELHSLHREIRRGDARDGARVSLGKLPEVVPVVRRATADVAEPPASEPSAVPESAPVPLTDPSPARADSCAPDAVTAAAVAAPEPAAGAPNATAADRLAAECARFVAEHEAVAVTPGARGFVTVGSIDRAANPADFAAFMALVESLAGEGVDVARVAVSGGPDGLPAGVTFPVSSSDGGELK